MGGSKRTLEITDVSPYPASRCSVDQEGSTYHINPRLPNGERKPRYPWTSGRGGQAKGFYQLGKAQCRTGSVSFRLRIRINIEELPAHQLDVAREVVVTSKGSSAPRTGGCDDGPGGPDSFSSRDPLGGWRERCTYPLQGS